MDFATHILVPWVLAQSVVMAHRRLALRRGVAQDAVAGAYARGSAWAAVFGLAALGPDLDSLISWARHIDGFWWAQHRGITHTVWGAALTGLMVVGALHLLARRWPRWFAAFAFRRSFLWAGILGGLAGIALDIPTLGGIPALWPYDGIRLIRPPFHWLVFWLFPVSLGLIAWRLSGRLRDDRFVAYGMVVILVLLALTGLRFAAMPPAPEGGSVHARTALDEWIVLRPLDGDPAYGWNTTLLRDGVEVAAFDVQATRGPVAFAGRDWGRSEVLEAIGDTNAHRGFRMNAVSPIVLQWHTESVGVGAKGDDRVVALNVSIVDPAARMDARQGARWTPADPTESWGLLRMRLFDDGSVVVVQQGW